MQREIEALLNAYLQDRSQEARLVQDLLTALAVGSAARHRMVQELASAVGQTTAGLSAAQKASPATLTDDITVAVTQLRAARNTSATH